MSMRLDIETAKAVYRRAIDAAASDGEGMVWWTGVADELLQVIQAGNTNAAAAAADEARRVLGRRDGDVGWLRGAPENMPLALVKSEALVDDTFDDCPLSG
ncbi:hypothetical protein [Paraburkholderia mimosarum]|uniref:hypothetical protein n=1 Tax=Paraburkholderia mimosarum TaxID=312026 RepID=UPI000568C08A|nr:hypothetical protein [Paraburkholderia mimosarum]